MEQLVSALDTLFVLIGAVMVLAMHAGFAFLKSARCAIKTKSMHSSKSLLTLPFRPLLIFSLVTTSPTTPTSSVVLPP